MGNVLFTSSALKAIKETNVDDSINHGSKKQNSIDAICTSKETNSN